MSRPENDLELVYRYLDGEMSGAELERFRVRVEQEPGLRSALEEGQEVRGWFAPGRAISEPEPDPGFTGRVLAPVRRLPSREELIQSGALDPTEVRQLLGLSHKLLAAALVLAGLFAALAAGLFFPPETDRLEASPDEIRTEMEKLDALILSGGGSARRPEETGGK